ncbi:MAG TPA: hypothetical protein VIX63_00170 [Vicinamibacterales bacterium]
MRIRRALVPPLVAVAVAVLVLAGVAAGQAQRRGGAAPPAGRGGTQAPQVHANLNQVMRGILFINANIIFAAQTTNPATIKPAKDAATATDSLQSIYGGWTAIENAGLAIAEAANLLIIPGRMCSSGKPVPLQNADWPKFVQGLREAGMTTVKAARAKSEDAILEAAEAVVTACANCHEVYRDKTPQQGGDANRCVQ